MNFNKIICGVLLCASTVPGYAASQLQGDAIIVNPSAAILIGESKTATVGSNIDLSGAVVPTVAYDQETKTFEPGSVDATGTLQLGTDKKINGIARVIQATEQEKTNLLQTFDEITKLPNQKIAHVVKLGYPFVSKDITLKQGSDNINVAEDVDNDVTDRVTGELKADLPTMQVQQQKFNDTEKKQPLFRDTAGNQYYKVDAVYKSTETGNAEFTGNPNALEPVMADVEEQAPYGADQFLYEDENGIRYCGPKNATSFSQCKDTVFDVGATEPTRMPKIETDNNEGQYYVFKATMDFSTPGYNTQIGKNQTIYKETRESNAEYYTALTPPTVLDCAIDTNLETFLADKIVQVYAEHDTGDVKYEKYSHNDIELYKKEDGDYYLCDDTPYKGATEGITPVIIAKAQEHLEGTGLDKNMVYTNPFGQKYFKVAADATLYVPADPKDEILTNLETLTAVEDRKYTTTITPESPDAKTYYAVAAGEYVPMGIKLNDTNIDTEILTLTDNKTDVEALTPVWQQNQLTTGEPDNHPLFQDARGNQFFRETNVQYQKLKADGSVDGALTEVEPEGGLTPVMAEQPQVLTMDNGTLLPNLVGGPEEGKSLNVYSTVIDNVSSKVYADETTTPKAYYLAAHSPFGQRSGDVIEKAMVEGEVQEMHTIGTGVTGVDEGKYPKFTITGTKVEVYKTSADGVTPDAYYYVNAVEADTIADDTAAKEANDPVDITGKTFTEVMATTMEQGKTEEGKLLFTIRRGNVPADNIEVYFDGTNYQTFTPDADGNITTGSASILASEKKLASVITAVMMGDGTQKTIADAGEPTTTYPVYKVATYNDNTEVYQDGDRYFLTKVKNITTKAASDNGSEVKYILDTTVLNPVMEPIMETVETVAENVALFLRADISDNNQLKPLFTKDQPLTDAELLEDKLQTLALKETVAVNSALVSYPEFDSKGNEIFPTPINLRAEAAATFSGDNSMFKDGTFVCKAKVTLANSESMPQSDILIAGKQTLDATAAPEITVGAGKKVTVGHTADTDSANTTFAYKTLNVTKKSKLVL